MLIATSGIRFINYSYCSREKCLCISEQNFRFHLAPLSSFHKPIKIHKPLRLEALPTLGPSFLYFVLLPNLSTQLLVSVLLYRKYIRI